MIPVTNVYLSGTQFLMIKLGSKPAFFVLSAVSLVAAWTPLTATFSLARRDEAYTHIFLILPVAAALILLEWFAQKPSPAPDLRAGVTLLLGSFVIGSLARWGATSLPADQRLSLSLLALVIWWIGSFVLCFGTRVARSSLFPLAFLFLLVPLPEVPLNEIVIGLQRGSAFVAHGLFWVAGVPVAQDGIQIDIPGLTIEVAKECSSIRSSSMLLVTTMILAQLFLHTPWRKWLVIALAIPLSVAKNGLRIFTIAMLGTKVDPSYLTGRLHHQGGVVFFAIGLGGVFFALWILQRGERRSLPKPIFHAPAS